jgi:hypothetical protein
VRAAKGRSGLKKMLNRNECSPSGSYREIYNKDARDHIARVFARDIEHFGYDFLSTNPRRGRAPAARTARRAKIGALTGL